MSFINFANVQMLLMFLVLLFCALAKTTFSRFEEIFGVARRKKKEKNLMKYKRFHNWSSFMLATISGSLNFHFDLSTCLAEPDALASYRDVICDDFMSRFAV